MPKLFPQYPRVLPLLWWKWKIPGFDIRGIEAEVKVLDIIQGKSQK